MGVPFLVRSAYDGEYFLELILDIFAGEEGFEGGHFGEDAANGPDIDGVGVVFVAEENIGGPIP